MSSRRVIGLAGLSLLVPRIATAAFLPRGPTLARLDELLSQRAPPGTSHERVAALLTLV